MRSIKQSFRFLATRPRSVRALVLVLGIQYDTAVLDGDLTFNMCVMFVGCRVRRLYVYKLPSSACTHFVRLHKNKSCFVRRAINDIGQCGAASQYIYMP